MRLTALLLPEPQGPFRATTAPSGALILRILAARVFANGSIPVIRWFTDRLIIVWSVGLYHGDYRSGRSLMCQGSTEQFGWDDITTDVGAMWSRSRDYAISNVFGLWTSRLHIRFVASIVGGIKWPYPGNAR